MASWSIHETCLPTATDTDYDLKVGSPAINKGKKPDLPGGNLTYDYRKTTSRPNDSRYDIGAFEFISGSCYNIVAP